MLSYLLEKKYGIIYTTLPLSISLSTNRLCQHIFKNNPHWIVINKGMTEIQHYIHETTTTERKQNYLPPAPPPPPFPQPKQKNTLQLLTFNLNILVHNPHRLVVSNGIVEFDTSDYVPLKLFYLPSFKSSNRDTNNN